MGVVVDLLVEGWVLYWPALMAAVLLVRISGFAASLDEAFERMKLPVFIITFCIWEGAWVLRAVFFFAAFAAPPTRSQRVVGSCVGAACAAALLLLASSLLVIAARRAMARKS